MWWRNLGADRRAPEEPQATPPVEAAAPQATRLLEGKDGKEARGSGAVRVCLVRLCVRRWGLLLPTLFVLATGITNVLFKDSLILKGPCPNCGAENFSYFGEVLTVAGNRGQNTVRGVWSLAADRPRASRPLRPPRCGPR